MQLECTPTQLCFEGHGRRRVEAGPGGGRLTTDGGVLLREVDRRFRERGHRTRTSWSQKRRVVGKAEWLPGLRGENPRFVVTNLPPDQVGTQRLYEEVYCGRGDMENRIKEAQLWLFADRTYGHDARQPASLRGTGIPRVGERPGHAG